MNSLPIKADVMMPIDETYCGEPILACPFCGDHFVAISGIEVTSPGRKTGKVSIDPYGIHIDPNHEVDVRGSVVTIRYACERRHHWVQQLHFHKGTTYTKLFAIGGDNKLGPIWRD